MNARSTNGDERAARPPRLHIRARSIAIATLVVAAALLALWIFSHSTRVLGWVAAAAVLAAVIIPVVEALATKMRRGLALVIVLVAAISVIGLIIWASVDELEDEFHRLETAAPSAAQDIERMDSWIGEAAREFGLRDRVDSFIADIPSRLAGGDPAEAVRAAASRGLAVLITLVLTIFLVGHGPRMVRGVLRQLPDERRGPLSRDLHRAYIAAWRYGAAMLGKLVVVGLITWAVARLLDLPAPSVIGAIVALTSVIPHLGIALSGLGFVLLAGGLHGGGVATIAAFAIAALQVGDSFVLSRFIEPRTVRVGPAASLAVALLAISLYGVGGAAVGLAIATFAVAYLEARLPDLGPEQAEAPDAEVPEPQLP